MIAGEPVAKLRNPDVSPLQADIDDFIDQERHLHLCVGQKGRLATLDNALSGYARFGITRQDALEIIDRVWRVVREWRVRFESYGVVGREIEAIASAFRHLDEVASPDLKKML